MSETRNPVLVALVVSCASFMQSLDGTVIATALPQMAKGFGVSAVDLSIGITLYLMTVAVLAPISSWISDRFGARTVFVLAMGVFTFASVLCGMSHGLWEFAAARTLQGVGGSMMQPVGQLLLLRGTEKRDLVKAITIATTPALIAPVVGPPIGGFITTYIGWPWIFYLNVPIGLIGMILVMRILPNPRGARDAPFDTLGFGLNASAIAFLIYGMSRLGAEGQSWVLPGVLTALGTALGALALRHARVHPHPIIPFTPLRYQTFRSTTLTAGTALRLQVRLMPFIIPLMLQLGFGMSAFESGLIFLGHTAGDVLLKTITTRTLRRFGFRQIFLWCTVLFALSIGACVFLTDTTPVWIIFVLLALSGAFRSPLFTGLSTLAYAEIPPAEISGATALANVINQVTGALAISMAALLLNLTIAARGGIAGQPAVADFRVVLGLSASIALLALIPFRALPHDTGAEVSGHRPPERPK